MLVDSHAHLNSDAFIEDLPEVAARCREMLVINIGTQLSSSKKAIKLAKKFDNFYATVGLHPLYIGNGHKFDSVEENLEQEEVDLIGCEATIEAFKPLLAEKKVVAIGEIGLDYSRIEEKDDQIIVEQKKYFESQLDLAMDNSLPVVIHSRGAKVNQSLPYEEILKILRKRSLKGVIHCYGGNVELAKKFVELGYFIGITGIVTFGKKADDIVDVVRNIPLENLLIETDSPYLAPVPYRGKRNEPPYVATVAEKIAQIKNTDIDSVINQTAENAKILFHL